MLRKVNRLTSIVIEMGQLFSIIRALEPFLIFSKVSYFLIVNIMIVILCCVG